MTHTAEELRSEIARTREELADTAAALAYKADVKSRAKERAGELKAHATGRVQHAKQRASNVTPAAAGTAASSAKQSVRAHPIPAAAVATALLGFALGLGYLLAQHR